MVHPKGVKGEKFCKYDIGVNLYVYEGADVEYVVIFSFQPDLRLLTRPYFHKISMHCNITRIVICISVEMNMFMNLNS